MPYKHIASQLKKTELACRLHYHQLSHGSNRRKRANSMTSSAGSKTTSPVLSTAIRSPIEEHAIMEGHSPSCSTCSPSAPANVQLPPPFSLLSRAVSPPRAHHDLVAILPQPTHPRRANSDSANTPNLRLDCGVVDSLTTSSIDKERLLKVYETHRASFWNIVAAEYGGGASPAILEEAWKLGVVVNGPPTPCISPDTHVSVGSDTLHGQYMAQAPYRHHQQIVTPVQESANKPNATRISALLGIDASPRSPLERELIRRMEESRETRETVMTGAEMV